MLDKLHETKRFQRQRASSWDRSGGNVDAVRLEPGQSQRIELAGPGIIRHLWMTVASQSATAYHDVHMSLRFDGAETPQVDLPLADFFCFGHGLLVDVDSLPIQVSRQDADQPHLKKPPFRGGLNCVFPMPFETQAEVVFSNHGDAFLFLFFYVDWELHDRLAEAPLHFHATRNQEHTAVPAGQLRQAHNAFDAAQPNLSTEENFVLLDIAKQRGHYVGTCLNVDCRTAGAGKWWEGDDMFVIDDEPWPPRLHGTGTEDYFNLAWGFRQVACRPEYGVTFLEKRTDDTSQIAGRYTAYRFHINDPIPFTRSLHASLEHGHANDAEVTYRSVAYWYGRPLD